MGIELIDVTKHSEQEIISEINKIIWILIERSNEEVGDGWEEADKAYTNNRPLYEESGDYYTLANNVTVSYSDNEIS